MSVVKNFLNRKHVSATVKVPFPPDKPEITFEIERFSEVEKHKATNEALMFSIRFSDSDNAELGYSLEFVRQMYILLERHVVGWSTHSDDIPEFSQANLKTLWSSFDSNQAQMIVVGYQSACKADEETNEKNG